MSIHRLTWSRSRLRTFEYLIANAHVVASIIPFTRSPLSAQTSTTGVVVEIFTPNENDIRSFTCFAIDRARDTRLAKSLNRNNPSRACDGQDLRWRCSPFNNVYLHVTVRCQFTIGFVNSVSDILNLYTSYFINLYTGRAVGLSIIFRSVPPVPTVGISKPVWFFFANFLIQIQRLTLCYPRSQIKYFFIVYAYFFLFSIDKCPSYLTSNWYRAQQFYRFGAATYSSLRPYTGSEYQWHSVLYFMTCTENERTRNGCDL